MKILVINSGSSSVKFKLFEMRNESVTASGFVERIGEEASHTQLSFGETTVEHRDPVPDHGEALERVRALLIDHGVLRDFAELDGIGHRVVHGGERFNAPVRITGDVLEAIEALSPLAPLHNPANAKGIRALRTLAPDVPQIAVFDTAFHHTMPPVAFHYALPPVYYEKHAVRRYGFHGTSHAYVAAECAARMGRSADSVNLITLHLGNGASACAIRSGRSIDTSMGFTPLEGLVMGTRSGDFDPGLLAFLSRETKMDAEALDSMLNHESGLKGVAGTNDMREIEARMRDEEPSAMLAFDLFVRRIRKYIGAYAVLLDRVDAIVFTGGIGEHSASVRRAVSKGLYILGVETDFEANDAIGAKGGTFHTERSHIQLHVVPTDEERSIARQTLPYLSAGR
jgi:acetate kinase